MSDGRTLLSGKDMMWMNITIPVASAPVTLWSLVLAGGSADEDTRMERIMAWKIFKEKDTALAAYNVGDAALAVAKAFGANEECSSADFPVYGHGLKSIYIAAAAEATITAGFYAILAPTKL